MFPKMPVAALAVAGMLVAAPARADEVTSLLDQGSYWLQLSQSSIELSGKVSARKEKCRWARQGRGELVKAIGYYDEAERRAPSQPNWSAADRTKLGQMAQTVRGLLPRTDALIQQLC
jgi:hypothetical protein